MMAKKVFVSHSIADTQWAREFADTLRGRGVQVWVDSTDLRPGEPWEDAMEKALRSSDIVVSLLNADTLNSANVYFEIGAAFGMGKQVIAVVPEEADSARAAAPLRFRRSIRKQSPVATAQQLLSTAMLSDNAA